MSHLGRMRSSSRKVERSRFRRKRIRRNRWFQASDIQCSSPRANRAKNRKLNSLHSRTQGSLVQDRSDRDERRHRPPHDKSQFEREFWDAKVASEPSKTSPDKRRAKDAEQPACRRDHPEPETSACGG